MTRMLIDLSVVAYCGYWLSRVVFRPPQIGAEWLAMTLLIVAGIAALDALEAYKECNSRQR